jgi:hypothetical protein
VLTGRKGRTRGEVLDAEPKLGVVLVFQCLPLALCVPGHFFEGLN